MTKADAGGTRSRGSGRWRVALPASIAALVLAGCGNSGGTASPQNEFKPVEQTGGKLTVWVDSTRLAAAQLYQKQNPSVPMDIVTYDGDANGSNYLQTKVSLFNRTGSGWPDVVFSSQNNEATWAVQAKFTAPLNKGLLPQQVLDGWAHGANDPCMVDGTLYCLRNDLSQTVLWYNASLMQQWGYQVPTTWDQYEDIGKKLAAEHPGYLVGSAGDTFTPEIYLWAGKCGANQITGPKAVTVDTTSATCTRMASLLDTLITNKTLSTSSVFSSDFGKNYADKILMMPGPAWYGGALFQEAFKVPAGQIAVAPMPQWSGDDKPSVGNVGGGTWLLSAHSANLKAATDFLTWVTTSDDYQGKLAPGYPAHAPAAKTWLANQATSKYYANDIAAPLQAAAGQVWPGWGYGQFSQEAIWAATVTPGLNAGKSIVSMLPDWKTAIVNHARSDGYQVNQQ
ncbi:multiple sugar transport system substrate-binding protein [Kibdelosporangium banguiense]|uniref:Multiple sugar transport system substrate-binding protein n=1 Tax=Kibdelosporangium banguiense TaxID=1365924 RepID=A0ABS4TV04_9PSEU|nr:ABC transporter substrate-binding protein [Kibdelosporangium banguiense]MBP2328229.1 multiple sugar transport system substrate-binding protein [Kibdelosporangium banguiense]